MSLIDIIIRVLALIAAGSVVGMTIVRKKFEKGTVIWATYDSVGQKLTYVAMFAIAGATALYLLQLIGFVD